jgi:hypothetical protein
LKLAQVRCALCADAHFQSVHVEWQLQRCDQPLRNRRGGVLSRALCRHHEFIAAQARHDIARTHARLQALADLLQQVITGSMPHRIAATSSATATERTIDAIS